MLNQRLSHLYDCQAYVSFSRVKEDIHQCVHPLQTHQRPVCPVQDSSKSRSQGLSERSRNRPLRGCQINWRCMKGGILPLLCWCIAGATRGKDPAPIEDTVFLESVRGASSLRRIHSLPDIASSTRKTRLNARRTTKSTKFLIRRLFWSR